jgi:hypothetical protein
MVLWAIAFLFMLNVLATAVLWILRDAERLK